LVEDSATTVEAKRGKPILCERNTRKERHFERGKKQKEKENLGRQKVSRGGGPPPFAHHWEGCGGQQKRREERSNFKQVNVHNGWGL